MNSIGILQNPFLTSVRDIYVDMMNSYPALTDDILKWKCNGLTVSEYEELRKSILDVTTGNEELLMEDEKVQETLLILETAAISLAMQHLMEDIFRRKFLKETITNMLKDEKCSAEDIKRYIPYATNEEINRIKNQIQKEGLVASLLEA